ncbi:MAG: hypothetical protein LQ343_005307 [Gyalolechia ehrenbergii]|nr:MAG: hypothetical protein LQ343_005307 [Gyalolechia ehrenbergii]
MIEGQEHQRLENPQEPLSNDDNEREIFDMPMAFYADMGGFRLELRDGVSFPGNSRAIAWLVSQRLIKHRLFKPLMIEDKNKVDILLRLITLLQISYFLVTVIARCAQGLFITTAELTTASFIACSILAAFFWWHKPCDVLRPEPIKIDMSMEDLYKLTNPESTYRWEMTPLDWISREEWWWSKVWWNYVNILRGMGFSFGSDTKPIDRISDTYQGPLPRKEQYMLLVVTTGCFIIFFLAWNHDFPTRIELVFWRAVCTVLMSMLYVGLVISECIQAYPEMQQRSASWKWRSGSPSTTRWGNIPMPGCLSVLNSPKAKAITDRIDKVLEKIRNNSPNDDPSLRLPLKVILPMYFLGTVYWICRGYILIEDAIELRILPKSAYATVQWQNLWPHLG